jgi:aerobic carbon-monoxide dehydrogenase large subunit
VADSEKSTEAEVTWMAGEAYRAVFLRVHPTGKMVLSLTTEADGREGEYARLVADELGVPALDVKVVPADADRFGTGHGYNATPSPGTSAAVTSATGKILDKAKLLAGMALDTPPEALRWDGGAFTGGNGGQSRTIAEIAMYAHGTGALPPGVEGGLDAQTVYRD